jgi:Fur family ferric uptake transcriptional regulator
VEISKTVQKLKDRGLRITPIRKKIVEALHQAESPLSVGNILSKVTANKTTIYREMEVLREHDLINVIDLGDGTKRYELTAKGHHHHLICVKCKSVTELDLADDFTKEEALIASREKFTVLRHALEFFGICQRCNS